MVRFKSEVGTAVLNTPLLSHADRHPLTLTSQGNLTGFLKAIKSKRQGGNEKILLGLGPGALQGVIHSGVLETFLDADIMPHIDEIYGASVGLIVGLGVLGYKDKDQILRLFETVMQQKAVNPRALLSRRIVNTQALCLLLQDAIDIQKARASGVTLIGIATRSEDGMPFWYDVLAQEDPIAAVLASAAIPGATDKMPYPLHLDGKIVYTLDAVVSNPTPVPESYLRTGELGENTHMLIVSPYPLGGSPQRHEILYQIADPRLWRRPRARKAIRKSPQAAQEGWKFLQERMAAGDSLVLIQPEQVIPPLTVDWHTMRGYRLTAGQEARRLFVM